MWIEYFNGTETGSKAKEFIDGEDIVIVSTINISEVYRHFLAKKGEDDARDALSFLLGASFPIPVCSKTAIKAAEVKNEKKMGLGDAIILATAKNHGAEIVTCDSHFKKEEDVIFIKKGSK